MAFFCCPSEPSPLTIGLSLLTNNKYRVFVPICLIPAKWISGSFLFYCIYRLTWYWLRFIILNMDLLLSLKSFTSWGNSNLRTNRSCLLPCIFVSAFSVKVLSGWRMNGHKEIEVSQVTTKYHSQIYRITNRTHLVKLRRTKRYRFWSNCFFHIALCRYK